MGIKPFIQPDFTGQTGATYKGNIDSSVAALVRMAGWFHPQAQDVPGMTVRVLAGVVPAASGSVPVEVAAQSTAALVAPAAEPRKDIVYIDATTGTVGVVAGVENAAPVDPAVPAGKVPIARINWTVGMAEITNADLDDLRFILYGRLLERQIATSPGAFRTALGLPAALAGEGIKDDGAGALALDIAGLTAKSPADPLADYLVLYDPVAAAMRKVLLANLGIGGGTRNRVVNPGFAFNQRALTSVADDAYCLDGWYVLTETGSVTVAQQSLQEDGTPFNIRLTQPDATAKQIGLAQIIEANNCRDLRGQNATTKLRVRNSDGGQINYAILYSTFSADGVTSDFISAWNPNPTYIANIGSVIQGSVTPAANTWTDVDAITGAIPSNANNLIVFVWSNADMVQNATLDIARVKLEEGSSPTDFEEPDMVAEYQRVRRYFRRLGYGMHGQVIGSASQFHTGQTFESPMRAGPTVVLNTGSMTLERDDGMAMSASGASIVESFSDALGFAIRFNGISGGLDTRAAFLLTNSIDLISDL